MTVELQSDFQAFKPRTRPEVSVSLSSKYIRTSENQVFERQFAGNYFVRYHQLLEATKAAAQRRWPHTPLIFSLKEAKTAESEVVVMGTTYKEGKLKPNVLEELQKFSRIIDETSDGGGILTETSDSLFLEDPGSRVQVVSENCDSFRLTQVCSGLVVALKGKFDARGIFHADAWTLPGPIPAENRKLPQTSEARVLLVSGLRLGADEGRASTLLDWILGASEDERANEVAAVVVVGNSMISDHLTIADAFFASLASVCPVVVLPGHCDPTNFALPQQPIHSAIFGRAKSYANLNSTTNPANFEISGVRFLASAGQGEKEVRRYTEYADEGSLKLTFAARLMAPTAPDTLACYPVASDDGDSLVLNAAVDVYVAGGCEQVVVNRSFLKENSALVIGLPVFAETGQTILLRLADLSTEIVEISGDF